MADIEVQDTDDYKVSKTGRKIKAHRIVFNKGTDDGKKGITEMKKTYKAFVEQHTAELTEEQKNEIVAELTEALNGDLSAGEFIKDFVHSKNPKFEGKSKDKRKQMALAAYYAKQRNEEFNLDEASRNAVLKTTAKNTDDNDVHVTTLRKAGLHASQGAGANNHIIVPPEHEKKARELLSKHLKEDAENIDEKITIDSKGNRVGNSVKLQSHAGASKTDASVRAYYAKLKAERDKKKQEAPVKEELKGGQHKLDKNKNGKLDKHDFKLLRKEEAIDESENTHHTVDIDHMGGSDSNAKQHNITLKKTNKTSHSHDATGTKKNLQKFLAKHYDDHREAKELHPEVFKESVFDYKNNPRQTSDSSKTKTYHDVKKISTGTVYTKQFSKDGVSKGTGDDAAKKSEGAAKRGRGRPKKDKFAEAVEFLMSLSEESFDDMMEEGFDVFLEEFEQLDELSKSTLGSYIKMATNKMPSGLAVNAHQAGAEPTGSKARKGFLAKANKRIDGIAKATDRLTK